VGKGQYDASAGYVYTPNNVVSALTVTLTRSDTAKLGVPATVTIPAGSYYAYFDVAGKDTANSVRIIASASGYQGDTAYYRVMSPKVFSNSGGTYNNFSNGNNFYVYAADSLGNTHTRSTALTVSITVRDTSVVQIDSSTVTIAAGAYYNGSAHTSIRGIGSTWVVVSAAGHASDSTMYTVNTPKLSFSFYSSILGRRQYYGPSSYYVSTPDYVSAPLTLTITQKQPAVDSLTAASLTIPTSSYYQYFGFTAKANGADTLIVSAPGYLPDTAFIRVSSPRFYPPSISSTALTTSPQSSVYLYAADSTNNTHQVMDTIVVRVTSSDTTVIKPAQSVIRIVPGSSYAVLYYNYFGPGTASLTFTDSAGVYPSVTTNTVTVTGPSLLFSSGSLTLGMRQTSGSSNYYVYTQNNVASAVTVNLTSTDTRVISVPATVTIPAGSYYAYFPVVALDTVGTIQIQATATGFGPATPMTAQVTQPYFYLSTNSTPRTTSGPQSITVYSRDANGSSRATTEAVTVTLTSSSGAVALIDSATVTIPAGAYYSNTAKWTPVAVGSAQLSATDPRAAIYKYNTSTQNVSVSNPAASLSWSNIKLGLGQYTDQYASTSDYMTAATTVTLGHVGSVKVSIPSSVTIPSSGYYSYFRASGSAVGTDSVTASIASPYHVPDTAYVVVDSGRVDPISSWPSTLVVGDSVLVTMYARDVDGNTHSVLAAETFSISATSGLEIRKGNAVVTSLTIPADASSVSFYVKGTSAGSRTATITNSKYRTFITPAVSVTP
jgi:hypothetical protein